MEPVSKILTITNLWHASSRIWTCAEPEFMLCWLNLYSNDNQYIMAITPYTIYHTIYIYCVTMITTLLKESSESCALYLLKCTEWGEWPSRLRCYTVNWKDPCSNPTRHLAELWNPTLLQGSPWNLSQIKNQTQWSISG